MAKDTMHIDYESFSEVSLPDVGTHVYANHPSTEILMTGYAINDGPVLQIAQAEGEEPDPEFLEALVDTDVEKCAWNAPFEINLTRRFFGPVDVRQWRCAMVQAMHCSLPGSLDKAGPVVGLKDEFLKQSTGKALMRKFSFPRKPTKLDLSTRRYWYQDVPAWGEYLLYNRQDVVAERAIMKKLKKYRMSEDEQEIWVLDQEINFAGLPINMQMVDNAIEIYEEVLGGALVRMQELTGLPNPNSLSQLLPWLKAQDYMFEDCKKGHIKTARAYFDEKPEHWGDNWWINYRSNEALKEVLDLRLETSRTSIKKYYALRDATSPDGYLRYTLQMNGAARTGRDAGRIFQPQNLPRPEKRLEDMQEEIARAVETADAESIKLVHGNVFDVLASAIRPVMQAPPGMIFFDADLSAIENRVLGWLARCPKILEVFEKKLDPYISFATYLYNRPYEELWHEYKVLKNSAKRTIAKPGTLGAGYAMGAGKEWVNEETGEREASGLLKYAWDMGVTSFTLADAEHSIKTFRETFSEVKDYWYDMERAAKKCLTTHKPVECGVVRFEYEQPFLKMVLPSGRPLYYLRPRLEMTPTPWGDKRMQITYEGMNDKRQWVRINTTPGKIVENADQAISRDLLFHGMKLAKRRGCDLRLRVHDQLLGLCREEEADEKLKILVDSMEETPKWAKGLPLGSVGITTKYFVKD